MESDVRCLTCGEFEDECGCEPPTSDTPEAALAAALGRYVRRPAVFDGYTELAAAILAALPPGWCGHDDEMGEDRMTMNLMEAAIRKDQAEIARLRAALEGLVDEIDVHGQCICEGPYPRGSRHHPQCDDDPALLAAVDLARAALAPSEP